MTGEAHPDWPHGFGICCCGCGQATNIIRESNARLGRFRGQPSRFRQGHGRRLGWRVSIEDRGYSTACHIWLGSRNDEGYGLVAVHRRSRKTHAVAYERVHGRVPDGLVLDHLCRQTSCCNPDHLEPVTNAENSRRGLNSKITKAQARAIRDDTRRQVDIAADYGIHQTTVSAIKRQKTWSIDMGVVA